MRYLLIIIFVLITSCAGFMEEFNSYTCSEDVVRYYDEDGKFKGTSRQMNCVKK